MGNEEEVGCEIFIKSFLWLGFGVDCFRRVFVYLGGYFRVLGSWF